MAAIKVFMKDEEVDKPIVGIPKFPKKVSKNFKSRWILHKFIL